MDCPHRSLPHATPPARMPTVTCSQSAVSRFRSCGCGKYSQVPVSRKVGPSRSRSRSVPRERLIRGKLDDHLDTVDIKPSPNFAYLAHHDARLVALATQAEEHFASDPTITLFKLRQFGEVLAQRAAAKVGMFISVEEGQLRLIDRLFERNVIGAIQRTLFHELRRAGNIAVHE